MQKLVEIIELATFERAVAGVLSETEVDELKDHLSENPEMGDVIPGAGGVRKIRWAISGRGKRGGGRAIYYFYNQHNPLFLITFFTKTAKADLSAKDRAEMYKLAKELASECRNE